MHIADTEWGIRVTGAWGMDFVSSSPLFSTTPLFQNVSYKSFLFQNFHNRSFFLHLTISVDVIHHEYYEVEASWIFLYHWNFDFSSNHSIIYFSVWISFWTVIYHQIISMFPYSDGRCAILRNIPSAVMFFQRFIFPAKTFREKYSERIWVFHCR